MGPLENRVMAVLWVRRSASVREVQQALGDHRSLAYTTVMTTMDRLHKKGLLSRRREGLAYHYSPRIDETGWLARQARSLIDHLLPSLDRGSVAYFVEEARKAKPELVEELRRLIAEHKRA